MMKAYLSPLLILSTLSACASLGYKEPDRLRLFYQEGWKQALHQLDCPAAGVQVHDLGPDRMTLHGAKIGARGCGRQETYTYHQRLGWLPQEQFATIENNEESDYNFVYVNAR